MDCIATSLFECGRLCCKLLPAGALCSHLIGGCKKGRGRSFRLCSAARVANSVRPHVCSACFRRYSSKV